MTTSARVPHVQRPIVDKSSGFLGQDFYLSMSLLIAAIVIYGFSHTVGDNLIHAAPPRPWLLWVHGALFTGWLAFFILQSALVRTGNVRLHRTLGWFGAALASSMTVVGLITAIVMGRFDIQHQPGNIADITAFRLIPFWDIACFTVLFWLAVYWRRNPEMHRRLMLMATCALTDAAFGRFPWQIFQVWFFVAVDMLILLCVTRDWIVMRRVHAAYRYALPVLVAGQLFVMHTYLKASPWWMRISSAMLR